MQLWLDCGWKKAKEKKHKYHKRKNKEQATDTSAAIFFFFSQVLRIMSIFIHLVFLFPQYCTKMHRRSWYSNQREVKRFLRSDFSFPEAILTTYF